MDLSEVKHFRGMWTDSHTRPTSRHKSQLWREILSTNAELSPPLQPPPPPPPHPLTDTCPQNERDAAEDLRKGRHQERGSTEEVLTREDRRWREEEQEQIEDDEGEETLTQPRSHEAPSGGDQKGAMLMLSFSFPSLNKVGRLG